MTFRELATKCLRRADGNDLPLLRPDPPLTDTGNPEGWVTVTLGSNGQPMSPGPYLVGYGADWREFDDWDEAWLAHVMRGSTRFASHLLARVAILEQRNDT